MTAPLLARSRAELRDALSGAGGVAGAELALVPTMGGLHAGHTALMRRAREELSLGGRLVVSVFVNPMQFGPGEDLDHYPRTLEADLAACAAAGADIVFAPSVEEVYPAGEPVVTVDPGPLGAVLEGAFRPTHFRGVLTMVAKLFGLVRPEVAVFGQKDYQQLVLVRRMVSDLCMGVHVVGAQTVREPDGLALSTRNRYLDDKQRQQATVLFRALRAGLRDADRGPESALGAARAEIRRVHGVDLDYLEVTDPDLGPAPETGDGRMLIAARVGPTRLIDNIALRLGPERVGAAGGMQGARR